MDPGENSTMDFLGGRSRWVDARVELLDVQGLFGGRNVLVTGAGSVWVQIVSPDRQGLRETRYEQVVSRIPAEPPPEVAELLECAVRNDFVTLRSDDRPGIPDEARIRIRLTNRDGTTREAAFWEGNPALHADGGNTDRTRFDALYTRIRGFQANLEKTRPPVYQGPYRPDGWAAWIRSAEERLAHLPRPEPGQAPEGTQGDAMMVLTDHGRIQVSGGCEVHTEGLLLLECHGSGVKVILKNKRPYGFFLAANGEDLQDFQVLIDREKVAGFLSGLQSSLDHPLPNLHPSTRGARVEIRLPLESGTLHQELDELRGDRDVDPPLEIIETFVRQCADAYRKDRALFLGPYEDPVVEETTPPPDFWVPGLRLFHVYEKKQENVRGRPDGRTATQTWIVTTDGRRFAPRDIASSLGAIGFCPLQEEEAKRTAAVMIRLQNDPHVVHILDVSVPIEAYTTERVPPEIRKKILPPAAVKKNGGFDVVLFGYVQAMSGFPEEWLKKWRVRIGPGVYETVEEETLWSEKGAYCW
jgi:hypothetical protein